MQIYSSLNNSISMDDQAQRNWQTYQKLSKEYIEIGFTYKSNQILHKISDKKPRQCPYLLLLHITKIYHLNQFEIIFFAHILDKQMSEYESSEPIYNKEHQIFNPKSHEFSQETKEVLQQTLTQHSSDPMGLYDNGLLDGNYDQENMEERGPETDIEEVKRIYLYLLVIGYAVKYYLNEPMKIKPYEEFLKRTLPDFFPQVFTKWAREYGNSALNTTPRKINAYYMELGFLEGEEENADEKQGDDCQYQNYNQIVEELIKEVNKESMEKEEGFEEQKQDYGEHNASIRHQASAHLHPNQDNEEYDQ